MSQRRPDDRGTFHRRRNSRTSARVGVGRSSDSRIGPSISLATNQVVLDQDARPSGGPFSSLLDTTAAESPRMRGVSSCSLVMSSVGKYGSSNDGPASPVG